MQGPRDCAKHSAGQRLAPQPGSGIHQSKRSAPKFRDELLRPRFVHRIARKYRRRIFQLLTCNGRDQRQRLFDDMITLRIDAVRIESRAGASRGCESRCGAARLRRGRLGPSESSPASPPPHRTFCPHVTNTGPHLAPCFIREHCPPPSCEVGDVYGIHQRLQCARRAPRIPIRGRRAIRSNAPRSATQFASSAAPGVVLPRRAARELRRPSRPVAPPVRSPANALRVADDDGGLSSPQCHRDIEGIGRILVSVSARLTPPVCSL